MRELGAAVREERLINARSRYDAATRRANMPSLAGMLEVIESWAPGHELKVIDAPPSDPQTLGMDATVRGSVRIAGCPDPRMTELAGVCEECGAVGTHESWCSRRK